jgi:hypothetical protein
METVKSAKTADGAVFMYTREEVVYITGESYSV